MSEALTPVSGSKTAPTSTAEPVVATSTPITGASIRAHSDNALSSKVYIGPSGVDSTGYYLAPDESLEFDLVDLVRVYVLGSASGLLVVYFGLRP